MFTRGDEEAAPTSETNFTFDPCCSFPCQHGGICVQRTLHSYDCDCANLGYRGRDCRTPYFSTKLGEMFSFPFEYKCYFLCEEKLMWSVINHVQYLHESAVSKFYSGSNRPVNYPSRFNTRYDYVTLNSHFDASNMARVLPQVPVNCPTPMGALGPKLLPEENDVFNKVFLRRRFKRDPHGTNLLFLSFTEHLSYMLFKTDLPEGYDFSRLPEEFDSDHIYGKDGNTRLELRALQGGKLKVSFVNGEIYPPILAGSAEPSGDIEDIDICNRTLDVAPDITGINDLVVKGCTASVEMDYPEETKGLQFALAHPQFGKSPFLLLISTIWIREHNRVAEIIAKEHPDWDDEKIYQVTRLIITGELIHLTVTDYFKQLTQYNMDFVWNPLEFHEQLHADRIGIEMHQLKHWHAMFPDCIKIGNITYNLTETHHNSQLLTKYGVDFIADILSRDHAGKVTYRNYAEITRRTILDTLSEGRKYRLQPFNNYRKHYGLEPYKNMLQLCGDKKLATTLELFYGDVNSLELFVGMAVEKPQCSLFPPTQMAIGGPFIMKSVFSNPINSPVWWKPSTFGGEVGFKIVKGITLRGLFCLNMKSRCHGEEYISFHVPTRQELLEEAARKRRRLWCLEDDEIEIDINF